jgi:hypothetical protein
MWPSNRWSSPTRGSSEPRVSAMFQTEFDFQLPLGLIGEDGTLHRTGVMRRATAADEILPLKDPRVAKNGAYLIVILLSRVITRLDGVNQVTPKTIEELYATDLVYLQKLYNEINSVNGAGAVVCPQCQHQFAAEGLGAGGS